MGDDAVLGLAPAVLAQPIGVVIVLACRPAQRIDDLVDVCVGHGPEDRRQQVDYGYGLGLATGQRRPVGPHDALEALIERDCPAHAALRRPRGSSDVRKRLRAHESALAESYW